MLQHPCASALAPSVLVHQIRGHQHILELQRPKSTLKKQLGVLLPALHQAPSDRTRFHGWFAAHAPGVGPAFDLVVPVTETTVDTVWTQVRTIQFGRAV